MFIGNLLKYFSLKPNLPGNRSYIENDTVNAFWSSTSSSTSSNLPSIQEDDGMKHLASSAVLQMRFPNDLRYLAARKMLNSSRPVKIHLIVSDIFKLTILHCLTVLPFSIFFYLSNSLQQMIMTFVKNRRNFFIRCA